MNIKAISLMAVLALTGCASSSVLVGNQRPPIDPSRVRIYLDPPARFEKVALLDAGSRNSWAITDQGKTNKVMERLKQEAADLGANGILIGGMGDQQIGSVGSGQAWGYGNTAYGLGVSSGVFQKKGAGLAIYVFEDGQAQATVQPQAPVATASNAPQPQQQATQAQSQSQSQSQSGSTGGSGWRSWGSQSATAQQKTLYRCPGSDGSQVVTETPAAGCTVIAP
ncbi:hypothetical protein IB227_08210 [Stenotrophomonas sp. STM01]|uniref:hypothetical protein n=1 Tax=Stenotrophomonas sp. STM01 TaxID=2769278 RepID=UPI00178319CF|nr:hypothetical protein [Stenotrophomonas sp. STM01]MBD9535820.1 hypothetical protein [Stenotrophomonas sp. STM01]